MVCDKSSYLFPRQRFEGTRCPFLHVVSHFLSTLFRPLVSRFSLYYFHHPICVESDPSPLNQTHSIDTASTSTRYPAQHGVSSSPSSFSPSLDHLQPRYYLKDTTNLRKPHHCCGILTSREDIYLLHSEDAGQPYQGLGEGKSRWFDALKRPKADSWCKNGVGHGTVNRLRAI